MVARRRASKRGSGMVLEIKTNVLREIWAVMYLALGVFTVLSLYNNFGIIGEIWTSVLRPILGWGINILPAVFIICSFLLFFAKKISFAMSRIVGIILLMVAVLSIFHLYVPMESIYTEAQAGHYGGYVGFVMNFLFRQVLNIGNIGSVAVFLTILLIGVLLTFEISFATLFAFFKPEIKLVRQKPERKVKEEKEEENEEEEVTVSDEDDEDLTEDELLQEKAKIMSSHDGEEIVTIKRPIIERSSISPKERKIEIKEVDIEEQTLVNSDEEKAQDLAWEPPSMDLLTPADPDVATDDDLLQDNARKIREKLKQFGLEVEMHEVHVGPTVVQYTLRPDEGIKLSKITALKNDLALALAAKSVRIEAPIPGKSLVGIEVPNDHRTSVHLRELLESKEFSEMKPSQMKLPLGRDVAGKPICADLASMPHLLVAGSTGSGKSVGMNSFLLSLLYQNSPADLKFIMIDPKRVEMTAYNGIAHLLTPVITDPEKAAIALRWGVAEMNRRYQLLSEHRHRDIGEWNTCNEKHDEESDEIGHKQMPKIVIVIDELADLMMAAGKEVEASICRIAQMARAVGIHLIVATQRPSVDVVTGLIKANIPTRISYAVSSQIDSRTILDAAGAEDLLGKGDMLYLASDANKPTRVQGIFVSSKEIERVTNNIKIYGEPNYVDDVISPKVASQKVQGIPESDLMDMDDEALYEQALQIIMETRKASASMLQRRLKVGYARAARLLDLMEENGVIGPVNGAKPREIYLE